MPHMFICGQVGTGGSGDSVPLLPPFPVDPDTGVEQTESIPFDPFRPAVVITGPYACAPIRDRSITPRFLVVAAEMDAAPIGAWTLADPAQTVELDRTLSGAERTTFADAFVVPRSELNGFTARRLARWVIGDPPYFACRVGGQRFTIFDERVV